jgi:hypothetical protein
MTVVMMLVLPWLHEVRMRLFGTLCGCWGALIARLCRSRESEHSPLSPAPLPLVLALGDGRRSGEAQRSLSSSSDLDSMGWCSILAAQEAL